MILRQDDLIKLIKERAKEKKLSCREAQELAEQVEIPLIEIGRVADELGIKIVECQLGCF